LLTPRVVRQRLIGSTKLTTTDNHQAGSDEVCGGMTDGITKGMVDGMVGGKWQSREPLPEIRSHSLRGSSASKKSDAERTCCCAKKMPYAMPDIVDCTREAQEVVLGVPRLKKNRENRFSRVFFNHVFGCFSVRGAFKNTTKNLTQKPDQPWYLVLLWPPRNQTTTLPRPVKN
jgi:hypothetical protein